MRAVLLILIIAIVAIILAVASGFLNISQIRGARAPDVTATGNGLVAKDGQAPAFEVETGSVKVGTQDTSVKVPTLQVQTPGKDGEPVANNAM